jgi:putative ABC transport system substrate-binding protein
MKRREFITLIGTGAVWPFAAKAQSTQRVWRAGWLAEGGPENSGAVFFNALQELGYTEGQNLAVERRFASRRYERLPALASELVALKPDVIVAESTQALIALQQATTTIPVVMVLPGDPLTSGLIKSLSHPGGNITGTSLMSSDLGSKRIQLLKEIVPTIQRVAIIGNAKNASSASDMRAAEAAAKLIGLQVHAVGVDSSERLESGLQEIVNERPDGIVVVLDTLIFAHAERIAEIALRNRLASVVPDRRFVESGSLAGFGPNLDAISRHAAVYVHKIFKGAKPADLPVEQPTKFELVINLKTAKALGIKIPDSLLVTADEMIDP